MSIVDVAGSLFGCEHYRWAVERRFLRVESNDRFGSADLKMWVSAFFGTASDW